MRFKLIHIVVLLSMVLFFVPVSLHSTSFRESPHGDKTKLPKGCASCHKGHGIKNTPMLSDEKDSFCFRCHGESITMEMTRRMGYLSANTKGANLNRVFEKAYRHPVDKTGIHRYNETLPETDSSAPRHAECIDCHHYHYVTTSNTMEGIRGINRDGAIVENIQAEYELCFKCHSYSANLPADQTNKAELFKTSNPSYHPIISQGKNNTTPSLIQPLSESSTIKCTNCHNNDDPLGPKGPHASNYRYILARNFNESDGPESTFQYELCYGCHRRSSILGNESFKYHNRHISLEGTSCRTCHNPHASTSYSHLIDFNNLSIAPSSSGRLDFKDLGPKAGECFLTCHSKDHNPARYPLHALPSDKTSINSSRH
jgi:predicted CXXCH cytochrome family protein